MGVKNLCLWGLAAIFVVVIASCGDEATDQGDTGTGTGDNLYAYFAFDEGAGKYSKGFINGKEITLDVDNSTWYEGYNSYAAINIKTSTQVGMPKDFEFEEFTIDFWTKFIKTSTQECDTIASATFFHWGTHRYIILTSHCFAYNDTKHDFIFYPKYNTWYNIRFVYSKGHCAFYANGVAYFDEHLDEIIWQHYPLYLGGGYILDEFKFYNKAMFLN